MDVRKMIKYITEEVDLSDLCETLSHLDAAVIEIEGKTVIRVDFLNEMSLRFNKYDDDLSVSGSAPRSQQATVEKIAKEYGFVLGTVKFI